MHVRSIPQIRERAEIADWTAGHQLKVYLDQTASDILWMTPESEQDTFDKDRTKTRNGLGNGSKNGS